MQPRYQKSASLPLRVDVLRDLPVGRPAARPARRGWRPRRARARRRRCRTSRARRSRRRGRRCACSGAPRAASLRVAARMPCGVRLRLQQRQRLAGGSCSIRASVIGARHAAHHRAASRATLQQRDRESRATAAPSGQLAAFEAMCAPAQRLGPACAGRQLRRAGFGRPDCSVVSPHTAPIGASPTARPERRVQPRRDDDDPRIALRGARRRPRALHARRCTSSGRYSAARSIVLVARGAIAARPRSTRNLASPSAARAAARAGRRRAPGRASAGLRRAASSARRRSWSTGRRLSGSISDSSIAAWPW